MFLIEYISPGKSRILRKSGAKIIQKKAEVKTSAKMIKKMKKMMQFLGD